MIGNTFNKVKSQLASIKTQGPLSEHDYRLISTPSGFLHQCNYQGKPLRLFDFQIAYVDSLARLIATGKGRQLGHSEIGMAGTSVAKSHLFNPLTSIICSYNLRECKEKIQKALMFHEGIPSKMKLPIIHDNAYEIYFQSRGRGREPNRIISLFNPRGFTKADVYLDEMSLYENQKSIYTAASAVISWDQNRQIRVGGTPFGKGGLYYDILMNTNNQYQDFERHFWFWWDCSLFCIDIEQARIDAHLMSTEERVYKYGTHVIQGFFRNMDLEDFQQEFEICFNDSELAYFTYELILSSMGYFDWKDQETFPETIEDIRAMSQGTLYAGYDVGRTENTSELYVLDLRNIDQKGRNRATLREVFHESLKCQEFEYQKDYICKFMEVNQGIVGGLYIDCTGIGMNLAEDLEKLYPGKILGVHFTSENRNSIISTTKALMLDGMLQLYPDRSLISHFYSIKKHYTQSGNMVFIAERSEKKDDKHHADKFWAVGLACFAARSVVTIRPEIFTFGENWGALPEIDMFNCFKN